MVLQRLLLKRKADHKKPLRYADDAYIVTTFIDSPAAKMIFSFEIYNSQHELVCVGETTQVFTDFEGNLIITVPEFFEQWKQKVGLL